TQFGRVIKEYTERYDRGYWKVGLRSAEASYDLFSIGMIIVHLVEGSAKFAQFTTIAQIRQSVACQSGFDGMRKTVDGMLMGTFTTTKATMEHLLVEPNNYQWMLKGIEKREQRQNTSIVARYPKDKIVLCLSVTILCCTIVIFLF
ncbi:MAG: hypothetical protein ACRCWQ_00005, partial [Bacilli bacterium]